METILTYPQHQSGIHIKEKDDCRVYDLSMLTEMGDNVFSIEILNIFLTETPCELEKLHTAAVHKNNQMMEAIAHKLKSGTQFLKISQLIGLLETIESESRLSCEDDHLLQLVNKAIAVYAELVNPLLKEIELLKNNKLLKF